MIRIKILMKWLQIKGKIEKNFLYVRYESVQNRIPPFPRPTYR